MFQTFFKSLPAYCLLLDWLLPVLYRDMLLRVLLRDTLRRHLLRCWLVVLSLLGHRGVSRVGSLRWVVPRLSGCCSWCVGLALIWNTSLFCAEILVDGLGGRCSHGALDAVSTSLAVAGERNAEQRERGDEQDAEGIR